MRIFWEPPGALFLGFLDDHATGSTPEGWPILGTIDTASRHRHAAFVIAINDPRTRRSVADRLARTGVSRWGSVVYPDVRVHDSVHRGVGCSILGGCQLTTNICLGDHCILGALHSFLRHRFRKRGHNARHNEETTAQRAVDGSSATR